MRETITNAKGFTLMEIMLVVFVISLIAGFVIPTYTKSVLKTHERDAISQLGTIHAANSIYMARTNTYLDGTNLNASGLNSNLGLSIVNSGKSYDYDRLTTTSYSATASWDDSTDSNDFTLKLNEQPLSSTNPCCSAGNCPTRPNCPT